MRAKMVYLLLAALVLPACGGNPPPDVDWDLALCLATCDGTCVKNENGIWKCQPAPPPPLPEPQCPTFTDRGGTEQCQSDACGCYCEREWRPCESPDPCDACLPHQSCVAGECLGPPDERPICNRPPENRKCDCWNHPPGGAWGWKECSTPPPPSGCAPPEGVLIGYPGGKAKHHDEVKAATTALGPLPGMTPKQKLKALTDRLVADTGWCWFDGIEAVFVIREDGTWGEYHAVAFGAPYGWTNSGKGKWIGRHEDPRRTAEGLTYPDPRGYPMKFAIHNDPGRNRIDTTGLVFNSLDYTRAIRMGKYGNLPRASAPLRPENHFEREAWERLVFGDQRHWCNGEPMPWWQENPAVAKGVCVGVYRTCSEDGTICTEVNLP